MRLHFSIGALLMVLCVQEGGFAQPSSIFVTPQWLATRLSDPGLVLLHIGTKVEYDSAHIPGAQYLTLQEITTQTGKQSFEMPPVATLDSVFEAMGVSTKSIVVVYFGNDWVTPTARVYVTLDYLGLGDNTHILDGGLPAWRSAGHAATSELPAVRKGTLSSRVQETVIVETETIAARLNDPSLAIVDARTTDFFIGANPGSGRRAGHIPGAHSIPFPSVLDSASRVKEVGALRRLFAEAGVRDGSELVSYCHIGQQASLLYVVAKHLGFVPHLYDGSFEAWSSDPKLPVNRPIEEWLPKLISTEDLETLLKQDDPSVIDMRSDLFGYLKGHIPHAVFVHLESLRATNLGTPADVLTSDAYATLFGQLGLSMERPVVIYGASQGAHFGATYLAWILFGFGHHDVSVLNGGFEKWVKEGRQVSRTYPDIRPAPFPSSLSMLQSARLPQVRWIVDQKTGVLVDARTQSQFEGTDGPQIRLGRIPGAISHFWKTDLVESDSALVWKDLDELRSAYTRQGITPDKRIVVYCNSGSEASHVFFSLYCLLKYPNVKVYVPSWTEWAEHEELPVETGR